jgi:predicted DNA-binding protein YlxM (UPF0122 family)
MEKFVEQTLLFDFYGELLTEHQKSIYEDVVFGDLSYSEVAEEKNISRQSVHDLIKRCNRILEGYEEKLHLVQRFLVIKEKVEEIRESADDPEQIKRISEEILEEL